MGLMKQFSDPELFNSLSLGEKLTGALTTTLIGMGMTFVVLILLWVCITAITKTMHRGDALKPKAPAHMQVQPDDPKMHITPPVTGEAQAEVVAAITGAIAAYEAAESQAEKENLVR